VSRTLASVAFSSMPDSDASSSSPAAAPPPAAPPLPPPAPAAAADRVRTPAPAVPGLLLLLPVRAGPVRAAGRLKLPWGLPDGESGRCTGTQQSTGDPVSSFSFMGLSKQACSQKPCVAPTTLRLCCPAATKTDPASLTDAGADGPRLPVLPADAGRAAAAAAPLGFLPAAASCTISSSFLRLASSMQDSALSMLDRLPAWWVTTNNKSHTALRALTAPRDAVARLKQFKVQQTKRRTHEKL
jgi:hypothetical protein